MPTASELPIDTSADATQMADAMFGSGINIVSANYTGMGHASGIYSGGDTHAPDITPSDTGVILSTGRATDVTNSSGDVNVTAGKTTVNNTAGDAELSAISGQATYDAAILEAEFIPDGSTLTMQVVFSSEEYLEYVDSGFNDAVGIWVNGQPAQLTVGTGDITINNINDQDNSNLYIDNAQSDDNYNTEMDGFTVTLTLKAPVNPGQVNTIKIGIADGGDRAYDSNLMIAGDSVQTALVAGDDEITVPLGNEVTVDLLANDSSSVGGELQITHINGQPVSLGDTVTLATGEEIEITDAGLVLASAGTELGSNTFTYTVEDADGNTDVAFVNLETVTPCFLRGTQIRTARGPIPVEALEKGDLVMTKDHGAQPLLWVGRSRRRALGMDAPVRFDPGAFGDHGATAMSANHRLLVRSALAGMHFAEPEVLIRAKDLTHLPGVRLCETGQMIEYYHLLFERHEIVYGDDLPSESFQPGPLALRGFEDGARAELLRLKPEFMHCDEDALQSARVSLRSKEAQLLFPMNQKMPA
jgi:hypothetical protein